jgi:hypothetical protein
MLRRLKWSPIPLSRATLEALLRLRYRARLRLALGSDTATILLLDAGGGISCPSRAPVPEELNERITSPSCRVAGRIAASDNGLIIDDLTAVTLSAPRSEAGEVAGGVPLKVGGRLIGDPVGRPAPTYLGRPASVLELVGYRATLAIR